MPWDSGRVANSVGTHEHDESAKQSREVLVARAEAEWGDPNAAGVARVLTIGESFIRRVVLSADNGLR